MDVTIVTLSIVIIIFNNFLVAAMNIGMVRSILHLIQTYVLFSF